MTYQGHGYSTFEVGDVVYEGYTPVKHYLVTGVHPREPGPSTYPGELTLTLLTRKGEVITRNSAHLCDYRVLLEDHKRKAQNMQDAIDHLLEVQNAAQL